MYLPKYKIISKRVFARILEKSNVFVKKRLVSSIREVEVENIHLCNVNLY